MRVSVYLPTKNRHALLRRAVASVLEQSYQDWELIVVNDGSTDGTGEYLDQIAHADSRVVVIHNEHSVGAPRARNAALYRAGGEFVTGLDDDDYFHRNRVAAFLDYWRILEESGEKFSCLFSQELAEKEGVLTLGSKPGAIQWQDLFYYNCIGNQVFARRETIMDAGMFDERMPAWQDLDLFIRVLRRSGPARLLDAALYITNVDDRGDRISVGSKVRLLAAFRELERKWHECPRVMRQGLYLQAFNSYYGFKPGFADLVEFFSMGIHVKTLRTLAASYLRK